MKIKDALTVAVIALAATSTQMAMADGKNQTRGIVLPTPLQAPDSSSSASTTASSMERVEATPTLRETRTFHSSGHSGYSGEVYEGMAVATQKCASGKSVVTCDGSYVTVGPIIRSDHAPHYHESLPPVIHEYGTYSGPAMEPVYHHPEVSHHETQDPCHRDCNSHHHEAAFGTTFTGGVGHNVSGYGYGGRGVVLVASSGGRSSVLQHPAAKFTFGSRSGSGKSH